jgi:hypothetical protein
MVASPAAMMVLQTMALILIGSQCHKIGWTSPFATFVSCIY